MEKEIASAALMVSGRKRRMLRDAVASNLAVKMSPHSTAEQAKKGVSPRTCYVTFTLVRSLLKCHLLRELECPASKSSLSDKIVINGLLINSDDSG